MFLLRMFMGSNNTNNTITNSTSTSTNINTNTITNSTSTNINTNTNSTSTSTNINIDQLFSRNIRNNSIDAIDFKEKINTSMTLLKKEDTTKPDKIKICNYLCNKLHNIYRISAVNRDIIIDQLIKTIYYGEELILPLRLSYLRFKNEYIAYKVSINLFRFEPTIKPKINIIGYFQILKYILKTNIDMYNKIDCDDVFNDLEYIFNHPETTLSIKMEIADIHILNNKHERGNEMLDIVRQEEERIRRIQLAIPGNQIEHGHKDVYSDTQNVHNKTINSSVLKAAIYLIEKYRPNSKRVDIDDVKKILSKICGKYDFYSVDAVLQRIQFDTSCFTHLDYRFGLYDVFNALWNFIIEHEHKDELLKRLVEEMIAMSGYCSTGHLSRFINVIQGFTDDDDLLIKISGLDQTYVYISNFLQKLMMDAPEDVTDSIIDGNVKVFYEFIKKNINENIPNLIKELGDDIFYDYLLTSIKRYTKYDEWYIVDNKLIFKIEDS